MFLKTISVSYQSNLTGDESLIKVLISNLVDINAKDDDGNTPLHLSTSKGILLMIHYPLIKNTFCDKSYLPL